MLGVLSIACAAFCAQFPSEPIISEFDRGVKLARRVRKPGLGDLFRTPNPRPSLDSIFLSDKQNIGWWSNGYEQKPIEHVVWLSAPLLSRWLGFLSAQEYWSSEETSERWGNIVASLGTRRAFVIQLSAFPKIPTYEVGDEIRSNSNDLEQIRVIYTSGGSTVEMNILQLARWQSRDRFELDHFPWWQVLPISGALNGEFESIGEEPPLPLGDFHRSWYLAWIDEGSEEKFEVRVLSLRKERVAHFVASTQK